VKRFLILMLCLMVPAIVFAQNSEPLNYIPSDTTILGCLNFEKLMANPKVKELIDMADEDGEVKDFREKIKAAGYDFNKMFKSIYFFAHDTESPAAAAIITTDIPEDKMISIIKESSKETKTTESSHANKKIYSFKQKTGETLCLAYLEPKLIAAGNTVKNLKGIIDVKESVTKNSKMMTLMKGIDNSAVIWAVMDKKETAPPPPPPAGQEKQITPSSMIPLEDIIGGSFLLNFTGKNEENLLGSVKLTCKKAETAQLLAMQFQGFLAMGTTMMAQRAPQQQGGESPAQLAVDVSKAVKFVPDGNDLGISIELTPSLIDRIKKVSEGMKNQPAPGEAPSDQPPASQGKPTKKKDKRSAPKAESLPAND